MDDDGFIRVKLGMFDKDIPKEVFTEFRKRCLSGQVHAAVGAPTQHPHEPSSTYFQRLMTTEHENTCAQIVDVEFDSTGKRLVGKIKPAGPHADILRKLLDGGDVVFGMRSFHDRQDSHRKRPAHIATYDLVLNHEGVDNTNSPVEGGGS